MFNKFLINADIGLYLYLSTRSQYTAINTDVCFCPLSALNSGSFMIILIDSSNDLFEMLLGAIPFVINTKAIKRRESLEEFILNFKKEKWNLKFEKKIFFIYRKNFKIKLNDQSDISLEAIKNRIKNIVRHFIN